MASKIPEYESKETITPGVSMVDMVAATKGFRDAYSSLTAIGNSIAATANEQYQTQQAINLAQKDPNRKLGLAILPQDVKFKEIFLKQSFNELTTKGNQMLSDLNAEFSKLPNPSLNDFNSLKQKQNQFIQTIEKNAPSEISAQLKNYFNASTQSINNKILTKINAQQTAEILNNFSLSLKDASVNAFNALRAQDEVSAQQFYLTQKSLINDALNQRLIMPSKAAELTKAADESFKTNTQIAKMMNIFEEAGEIPAFEMINSLPDKTVEDSMVKNQVIQEYKKLKNQAQIADQTLLSNAELEIEKGMLTSDRLLYYNSVLSDNAFNKLQLRLLEKNKQQIIGQANLEYFNQNANFKPALDLMDSKDKDSIFLTLLEEEKKKTPNELEAMANVASRYDTSFKIFSRYLTSALESDTPEIAISAAKVYKKLNQVKINSVAGVSEDAKILAHVLMDKLEANQNNPQAELNAFNQVKDEIKNKIDYKKTAYVIENVIKKNKIEKPIDQKNLVAKKLGYNPQDVSNAVPKKFLDNLKAAYTKFPDINYEAAVNYALGGILGTFGEFDGNGMKQLMAYSPYKYLPREMILEKMQKDFNDVLIKLDGFEPIEKQKPLSSIKDMPFFKPAVPLEDGIDPKTILRANKIVGRRKIPGRFIIREDSDTETLGDPDSLISYAWAFAPDDKSTIGATNILSDSNQLARFKITADDIASVNEDVLTRQKLEKEYQDLKRLKYLSLSTGGILGKIQANTLFQLFPDLYGVKK